MVEDERTAGEAPYPLALFVSVGVAPPGNELARAIGGQMPRQRPDLAFRSLPVEREQRRQRRAAGIVVDDTTWAEIGDAARKVGADWEN